MQQHGHRMVGRRCLNFVRSLTGIQEPSSWLCPPDGRKDRAAVKSSPKMGDRKFPIRAGEFENRFGDGDEVHQVGKGTTLTPPQGVPVRNDQNSLKLMEAASVAEMNRDEGIIAIASAAYAKAFLELPDQVRF